MKYLNLSKEEIRAIKLQTRKKAATSYATTTLMLLALSFCLVFVLKHLHLFNNTLLLSRYSMIMLAALPGVTAIIYYCLQNHSFRKEISDKKKRVYVGSIGEKKMKTVGNNNKYYLYMDGMKFRVNEEDYHAFEIGDGIELHVSLTHRYLLKVTRHSPFMQIA